MDRLSFIRSIESGFQKLGVTSGEFHSGQVSIVDGKFKVNGELLTVGGVNAVWSELPRLINLMVADAKSQNLIHYLDEVFSVLPYITD